MNLQKKWSVDRNCLLEKATEVRGNVTTISTGVNKTRRTSGAPPIAKEG